jgi:protein-S-isoprenylcysteine O-methyltransferase Ste14
VYAVFLIFIGSWYPADPTLAEWYAWMIGITVISVISGILIYAISQRTRRGKIDE